jgi:4-carboxymuconolactone decarboxylase
MIKRAIAASGLAASLALGTPVLAQTAKPVVRSVPTAAEPARTERERRAAEILRQMLSPEIAESMVAKKANDRFAGDLTRLSVENVYEQIWTRPGLGLRDRSLVTISMLIALGNERELKIHIEAGLRNGLTPQEIAEVIYQASAYAGFPRASGALAVASEVLARQGKKTP